MESVVTESQLLSNMAWISSVPNYAWNFIYALMACTEPISNKLTSSRQCFGKDFCNEP